MAKQSLQLGRRWYAIHTYSGYEENVTHNLTQRIESLDMQDKIFQVLVPKEKKLKSKTDGAQLLKKKFILAMF